MQKQPLIIITKINSKKFTHKDTKIKRISDGKIVNNTVKVKIQLEVKKMKKPKFLRNA